MDSPDINAETERIYRNGGSPEWVLKPNDDGTCDVFTGSGRYRVSAAEAAIESKRVLGFDITVRRDAP